MWFVGLLLIFGLMFIVSGIFNSGDYKAKREESCREYKAKIKEFEDKTVEYNIVNNIKCRVSGTNLGSSLVLTNDNKLYLVSRADFILKPIDIEKVLDVKVEYNISEKNKMKLISIRPTFNKHTKFESCTLKLMLEDRTINIYYFPNCPSDGCLELDAFDQNKYQAMDSMERMKLLIERELKKIN